MQTTLLFVAWSKDRSPLAEKTGPAREKRNPDHPWVPRNDHSGKKWNLLKKNVTVTPTLLTLVNFMEYMCVCVCIFILCILNNIKLIIYYSNIFNFSLPLNFSPLARLPFYPSCLPLSLPGCLPNSQRVTFFCDFFWGREDEYFV